jgi:tetratricopeptide (TPR) repeat protein
VIQAQVAMLKRSWDEAISRMQAVLNEISPTDSLRIKVLLRMGSCYTQKRMWQSAIECLCRAEAAAKQHDDVACEVLAAQELAATHREQGDLEHAEDAARRALDKAVTNQARAASYNVLGTVYLRRGNFDAAERAFNRSLEHLQETSDHFRRAKVLNNLGLLHADTARWPAAQEFFERSLHVEKERGDTFAQATVRSNLMRVYYASDRVTDGAQAAAIAIDQFIELHDSYRAAVTHLNLARILRRRGEPHQARSAFQAAANHFRAAGAVQEERQTHDELNRETGSVSFYVISGLIFLAVIIGFIALIAAIG